MREVPAESSMSTAAGDGGWDDGGWRESARAQMAVGGLGAVVFDDRRIVSAFGRGVQVRRFDI